MADDGITRGIESIESHESLDEDNAKQRSESIYVQYEWEEELEEYDEPDVYPSERDYRWFDEVVTDSEDEEEEKIKAEPAAETEELKEKEEEEEEEKKEEEEKEEVDKEAGEDVKKEAKQETEGADAETKEEGAEEEGEDEHFVPLKLEEEEEEEVVEVPTKKYKTIKVRKLVERPPKIHYEPDECRIDYSKGTGLEDRPFHFQHSFGYDCQRLANLHVLDGETLVFMSGFVLTFYNHSTRDKTYLRSLGGSCFGALAIHPSRRLFAAAEKGENPLIGIWSWNKLQLFRKLVHGTEKIYASVNFSPDGKLLASQGGEPDFLITVWNWLKEIPVLRIKSHAQDVYRVTFSKELAGLLTTSGLCHIKFWKMANTFTGLKLKGDIGRFGKTEITDIEGYVEMPDGKVLSGSEWGNLLVWENGLVIAELCIAPDVPCHKGNVRFISIVEGDFYSTGQDGVVKVWSFEAVDTAEIYTTEESLKVPMKTMSNVVVHEESDIWSIVPDPVSNDLMSVFWFAQDGKGKIWKIDLSFLNTAKEPEPLLIAHGGSVVACATSPMTYLVATLGADGRINVHDYVRKLLVASRTFNAPGSCLVWPAQGTDENYCTILCGFADGVLRILKLSQWQMEYRRPEDTLMLHLIIRKVYKPHRRTISSILMDYKGELLMTGSHDGTVFFFNIKEDYAPMQYIHLHAFEPILKLLWHKDKDDHDDVKVFIAICTGSVIQKLAVTKLYEHDNTVSYFSMNCKLLSHIHVKSIKSVLRHNEELERIRLAAEDREAALEAELRRMVEEGIETQSQQDIRLLIETEEREKEAAGRPKASKKVWEPYIPPTPSPIFEVLNDPLESDILHFTMGGYDTGYVYSVRLLPVKETLGDGSGEPINAVPIEDCDDVAVTKIIYTEDGERAVVGFQDGRIRIVNLGAPYDIKEMKHHWTEGIHDLVRGRVTDIAFDFTGMFLFTTGDDGNCFMFTTTSVDDATFFCSTADALVVPLSEDVGVADIVDNTEYTLEDSKNIAKEMALLAAAKRSKTARKEEIARLRLWFTDVVRRNNEMPEEIRLTPIEFKIASDNVARHEEAMKEKYAQLHLEMAWDSKWASVALGKLKEFYKDPIKNEQFSLRAFNSEMKVTSFRSTHLPNFYFDAIKKFYAQSHHRYSQLEGLSDMRSEQNLVERPRSPRPKRKRGMDKFVYQKMVRLWERRQKKKDREIEWDMFLRTDPSGKDLEEEELLIQQARENMGDLKLKTSTDYKVPQDQKLTVNKARKRLIDLEERLHILKEDFNNEMIKLRDFKIEHIRRMRGFKTEIIISRNSLPAEMQKPIPDVPDLAKDENPFLSTSYTREEVMSFKAAQQTRAETFVLDKSTKKVEQTKRRPGRGPIPPAQSQPEKPVTVVEKGIGAFVQTIQFPPSELEIQMEKISLMKAKFCQDHNIACIAKEKWKFDALLKLQRHKKIKLDYYIKTAENNMVLLTEEFLQAQRCEHVESKLEGVITNANKEQIKSTLSLRTVTKQIDTKKKELEEITSQRAGLLREVQDIGSKVPQYERYLIRVFKKKLAKAKKPSKKGEDDDEEDEESSEESDESDDMDMCDDEDTDDDLDVDLPPSDLKSEFYEGVVEIRTRRQVVDEMEEAIKISMDELAQQANGLKSRISGAERTLASTKAELDAFIYDKQNKLNSLDLAVSVNLHQIHYMAPDLTEALITTQQTIKRLRGRIPELKKEKRLQKKEVVETRKSFYGLVHSKHQFLERLNDKSKECDHQMLLKFGHVWPIEQLENFDADTDIGKLRAELYANQAEAWSVEKQLEQADLNLQCKRGHLTRHAASDLMIKAELTEELAKMNDSMETTLNFLSIKSCSSNFKEDIDGLKRLVLYQWKTLRDLQLEIATMTWRPKNIPLPSIQTNK